MTTELKRVGNFTSSEIWRLMCDGKTKGTPGKPFFTYIEEKAMERRLGRSLDSEISSKPTTWGKLLEKRAFDILDISYQFSSTETIKHPDIDCWAGSPDGYHNLENNKAVIDIKSPYTLKSFCELYNALYNGSIEFLINGTEHGEKYYWQLVSNATLSGNKLAELVLYMPYQEELQAIRELAENQDQSVLSKYFWIVNSRDEELPYLLSDRQYKNITSFRFRIEEERMQALTDRVIAAQRILNEISSETILTETV